MYAKDEKAIRADQVGRCTDPGTKNGFGKSLDRP